MDFAQVQPSCLQAEDPRSSQDSVGIGFVRFWRQAIAPVASAVRARSLTSSLRAAADTSSLCNRLIKDEGRLLFVYRIVVAIDVDRFHLYHRAPGAGYHVNV